MRYVNLGCGSRHHPDWLNFDLVPSSPVVKRFDITRPLPLGDGSCDVVYHAAVLEHLRRPDAARFLADCNRVLKPGGVIRVGVPDLERICRLYLEKLEASLKGDAQAEADYDWVMLELLDQTVRERSGGEMLGYLKQNSLPNEAFVLERIGVEGHEILDAVRRPVVEGGIIHRLRQAVRSACLPRSVRIGKFRLGGEVHQWMYDRFSLGRLLWAAGFTEITPRTATDSRIEGWGRFGLDVTPDGVVIKPDLFFMEAVKPSGPADSGDAK